MQEAGLDALLEDGEDESAVVRTRRGYVRARGPNQSRYLRALAAGVPGRAENMKLKLWSKSSSSISFMVS